MQIKRIKIFLGILFLLVLCGCHKNEGSAEQIQIEQMVDEYETAIKSYDFDKADSFWVNPQDNKYVSMISDIPDDAIEVEVCREIYVEKLKFDLSDIEVKGDTASAKVDISICMYWGFLEKIPKSYDVDELRGKDKSEIKAEFEKELSNYNETWKNGSVVFVKDNDVWKIESIKY